MKKLLIPFTFYFSLFTLYFASAQNVGIGTNTPNPSAQLDVTSTNRGFLLPRMTFVQRNSISNPATGLMVYCTDCGAKGEWQGYNGTEWTNMIGGPTQAAFAVITTTAVSSITETAATSGGNITSDGGGTVTARGVVWSTSVNPTITLATKTSNGSGTGIFTSNITGLTAGTTYYVRAYATNSTGTAYGNEVSFTSASSASITDGDGNTYPTITIGSQVWMAENLRTTKYRDGSSIPLVSSYTDWANNWNNGNPLKTPMMCWYLNDPSTYAANKFGALYNWYAVNPATNGNKNVCPTGWHVPSVGDWITLINFLDPSADGGNNYLNIGGGKMKSTGTQYWASPNQDATNSSGFSGLPGGYRYTDAGFNLVGIIGRWWSTTEDYSTKALARSLESNVGHVLTDSEFKSSGLSVRCVKD